MLSMSLLAATAAETASSVLDRAAAKINGAPSISTEYTITAGSRSEQGRLLMSAGRFALESPSLRTWYDGINLWSYSPSLGEVNITAPTADELTEINPFAIINNYAALYTATITGSTDKVYTIQLTPRRKGATFTKGVLTISKSTLFPESIALTMADGSAIYIKVSKVVPGKKLPASAFTFDKSVAPGAEIIDLR